MDGGGGRSIPGDRQQQLDALNTPFLQWGCSRCPPVIYGVPGLKWDSVASLARCLGGFPSCNNWINRHGSRLLHSILFIQCYISLLSDSLQIDLHKSFFSVFSACLFIRLQVAINKCIVLNVILSFMKQIVTRQKKNCLECNLLGARKVDITNEWMKDIIQNDPIWLCKL